MDDDGQSFMSARLGYGIQVLVKHQFRHCREGFLFWPRATQHMGSQFPNQGSNLLLLHWKHRILTTGPPGKSHVKVFF